ncbi:hypothetical protein PQR67_35645 [Paraburkholderia fungorum]|uniref:ThiF family adenylyltransferase n=1 Tax=Paraburkholderia fungorum TaxID=134537 RepID=UPI0038BAA551
MPLTMAIDDALTVLRAHPSVSDVRVEEAADGMVVVTADFDTNLPSTWRAIGASPTGVRPVETVEFRFPAEYPRRAPHPTLRPDFNATLPHINPHRRGDRVPPCLVFGSTLDVLHSEGVGRLFGQMAVWLEKAAENKLIDYGQGWEPTRRDNCQDMLEIDVDALVTDQHLFGNAKLYRVSTVWSMAVRGSYGWNQRTARPTLDKGELLKLYRNVRSEDDLRFGETVLAICWPGIGGDGAPPAIGHYQPDTVQTLSDIKRRADEVGCAQAFERFTANLDAVARQLKGPVALPVYVVLAIRRPAHLIGLATEYELLAYRFDLRVPEALRSPDAIPVAPVLFTTPLSVGLLRRTSGLGDAVPTVDFGFVGCGSLGSKVALHIARAGVQPKLLVDHDRFSPHNAARHALFPAQLNSVVSKSRQLASVLAPFSGGRKPAVFEGDVMVMPFADKSFNEFFDSSRSVLVNTTGSPSVRHFLAHAPFGARVMEACALNLGEVGLLTVEGAGRNPTTADLVVYAYERMRREGILRAPQSEHKSVVGVGVGCNSVTLPMTDARISLIAAGAGQFALNLQRDGLSEHGTISLAQVSTDGMSVAWSGEDIAATHVVPVSDKAGWTVRVLGPAHRKICADVANYPTVETGGVVVGRVSPTLREITIADVLDAPPDSRRSAGTFVLGTEGLTERIAAYDESGRRVLWCLGTWHSHLQPAGPSATDVATANRLEGTLAGAVVLLIRRPDGYSALVRDGHQ